MQSLRAEPRDHDAAVGRRRGVGIRRFDVTFLNRLALVSDSFPLNPAGAFVERVDDPTMRRAIFRRITITVKSGTKRCLWITADGGGHEDPISPNYRTRVCQPGNRCAPEDVLAVLCVPLVGKILTVGDARGLRATK